MKRLRWLSALLACLAALATGAPAFASVSSSAMHGTSTGMDVAPKCHDCPDCDSAPCPQSVDCVMACTMAATALVALLVELPVVAHVATTEEGRIDRLVGERPPPD